MVSEQVVNGLKAVEKRLADMAVLIKNVDPYQKTKFVYDTYCKVKNKSNYWADMNRQ